MKPLNIFPAMLVSLCCVVTGCYETQVIQLDDMPTESKQNSDTSLIETSDGTAMEELESAGFKFDAPVRIKAGSEFVSVETPGYASPTMADVDGDGAADLVVGQFLEGRMQFFKNVSSANETPKFASGDWIMSGDQRAVVPGVW